MFHASSECRRHFDPLKVSSATVLKEDDNELTSEELELKESLKVYQEVVGSTEGDDPEISEALDALHQAYMSLGYWSDALGVEQRKCRIFFEEGTDEYFDSLHVQGKLYLREGNFEKSGELYQESLKYFQEVGNDVQQGHVLISLAGWYYFRDQLDLSMEHLVKAESLLDANPTLLVKCLDNQGLICRSYGDYGDALDKYQQALQVVVDDETRYAVKLHIADMLVALEEPHQALAMYQELVLETQQNENSDTGMQGVIWHNIATLHVEDGEYDLAVEEFRTAIQLKQESGGEDHPEVAKSWNSLGALHYGYLDEKMQALECFKHALWIARIQAEDPKSDPEVMAALQTISDLEQRINQDR